MTPENRFIFRRKLECFRTKIFYAVDVERHFIRGLLNLALCVKIRQMRMY